LRLFLVVAVVGMPFFPSPVAAQQPAGRKVGLAAVLKGGYAGSKANLMDEAEKMSEADYGLKPGTMPEVRTFGQLFGHVAAGQFGVCAAVKGVSNPMGIKTLEDFKTKAEFVKVLSDSFAFCDDAFSSTTDENATEFIRQGPNELPRAAAFWATRPQF
jgi:hypothetical protein